jgi:hypothetical protein
MVLPITNLINLEDRFWHFPDMLAAPTNVRYWG